MSGRKKRIFYQVFTIVLWLAAFAAMILMWWGTKYWLLLAVAGAFILFPVNVLVHELGHLLVGACAGMRFSAFRVGNLTVCKRDGKFRIRYADSNLTAGETAFAPKSPRHMRARFLLTALGGAVFNFAYAAVMLALFFILPHHPALLFFELFAPLSLYEGISALIPVELPAGKTDGAVVFGLLKKRPDELVSLAVLTAQGMLQKGSYRDIPRELLFDTPVVREDSTSFLALLQLRWQYLFVTDGEGALMPILRLASLYEELPVTAQAEVAGELAYVYSVLSPDEEQAARFASDVKAGFWKALLTATDADGAAQKEAKSLAAAEPALGVREYKEKLLAALAK